MLKNYLLVAWRNVKRNKGFFALNFTGLYISVVVCLLIALIILHETSFDVRNNSSITVYRVVRSSVSATGKSYTAVTQYPLATAMRAAMPEQSLISQIHYQKDDIISFGNKKFKETKVIFADSVFPKLFPISVKQGSISRAFAEPGYAVLTENTAQKYFGNSNAVGQRIKLDNFMDLTVAAVVANPPSNTHLPYNMLVSYRSMDGRLIGGFPLDQWGLSADGFTYIGLTNKNQAAHTKTVLSSIADKYLNQDKNNHSITHYKLEALPDIHFDQLYSGNPGYTVSFTYLYLLAAIGLFLILAACINYTNLSTALAIKKSKEVGVRKTMGATRIHLIKQFLSETFLLTAVVILAAALSIRFFLPVLNDFLDKNIPLNWLTYKSAALLISLWLIISLFSGVYPAFVLSGFNPVAALKSKITAPKASVVNLRRGLVVFQFLTAQILIIGAVVVAKQMVFIRSTPLGFDKNMVVDIGLPENKPAQLQALRTNLLSIRGISDVSLSLGAPVADNQANTGFNTREKYNTSQLDVAIKAVDKEYLKTYGLTLIAGRWFNENDELKVADKVPDSLKQYAFVLNETSVKALGFKSPQEALGKYLTFGFNDISAPVIGVVKDYHVASLHEPVKPVMMVEFPFFYYNVGIKLSEGYSQKVLSDIEKAWTSIYPNSLFESNFLNDHVASLYKEEKRTQQLFTIFTILSIVINVLGLVGLLSFMIEQKTKEIGIRKVLGASIGSISFILSKDFLLLIGIAFLIAAPVAWLIMSKWLQNFAYRTNISWWIFAVSALAAVVVTVLAVGFQTVKAALANPVKALRSE
ncbi:MAG TPA: FtsX-like permease family protein [Chitinophagaceae bacterium]|nr:FtsX-like permease family protein [Chitinophagaceae bacterium]